MMSPVPKQRVGRGGITSWSLGEELGSGAFGCVFRGQDTQRGHLFAVKVSRTVDDRGQAEKLKRELDICSSLEHPHIVRYLGHEYVDQRLHIFLEFVPGGSLRRRLDEFGPLGEPLLRKASRGVLEGLEFLHTRSPPVVHRDLKCANILVDHCFCVKLADFGCSRWDNLSQSFTACGTVCWMAPEVITQQNGHGRKADIWSWGCVLIEMATAADPWGKGAFDNIMQAMNVILKGNIPPIPDSLSAAGRDMASRCLQRNPDQRPSSTVLLDHELVHDVNALDDC